MLNKFFNKRKEILGLNRRNQYYIRRLNPRKGKRIADNKLLTKKVLAQLNIKTPEVYKVIRHRSQVPFIDWDSLPKSFVLKPNRGSAGAGILVFYGKKKGQKAWIRPNGQIMTSSDISRHVEKILEGRFSMGGRKDIAIFEQRVVNHPILKPYCYKGIPDIRLIVFNNVPVMAMIRLPTKRSDGKANLHAGGICAGIDMASGVTTVAMQMKSGSFQEDTYEDVEFTYDTAEELPLSGLKIPFWDEILEIGIKCQQASGLGYVGVDIALDRSKGPVVFELNVRPGLGIQTANNAGLRSRLERIEGLKIKSIKHGMRVTKNLFGGVVEENIENLSGKQVINLVEKITIYHKAKTKGVKKPKIKQDKEKVKALMDTGITSSRIDKKLASRIGYGDVRKYFAESKIPKKFTDFNEAQEFIDKHEKEFTKHKDIIRLAKLIEKGQIRVRPVIEIKLILGGKKFEMEAILSDVSDQIYPILIGRRHLNDYLIDASKTFTK